MADQYGRDPFNGTSSDPALCVLVGQPSDYGNPCEKGNYQLDEVDRSFLTSISAGASSDRAIVESTETFVDIEGAAGSTNGSSVARGGLSYDHPTQETSNKVAVEDLNKRRAQNRAAQRAFRERKERHNAELHQEIDRLQHSMFDLRNENNHLQQEIANMITENQVLMRVPMMPPASQQNASQCFEFTSDHFFDLTVPDGHEKRPAYRLTVDNTTGEKLLDVGATWDLIQQHAYFKMGILDLVKVCERLRDHIQCDGQGPVFGEKFIFDAIESGVSSDELM